MSLANRVNGLSLVVIIAAVFGATMVGSTDALASCDLGDCLDNCDAEWWACDVGATADKADCDSQCGGNQACLDQCEVDYAQAQAACLSESSSCYSWCFTNCFI